MHTGWSIFQEPPLDLPITTNYPVGRYEPDWVPMGLVAFYLLWGEPTKLNC